MAITNTNYRQMIQDALESQNSASSYEDIKNYIFTNYQVKKGFGNWVEHILKQMVAKGEVSKDEENYVLAKYPVSSKKSTLSVCAMKRRHRKWKKRSKSRKRRSRSRRRRRRKSKRRSKSRKSRSRSRARSLRRRRRSRRRRTRSSARKGKRRSVSRVRRRRARLAGGRRKKYSKRGKRSGLKRYRKRRSSKRRYRKRSCCFRKAAKVARKKIRYSLKSADTTGQETA